MYYNVLFRKVEKDDVNYLQCVKILDEDEEFDRDKFKELDFDLDGNYFYKTFTEEEINDLGIVELLFYNSFLEMVTDNDLVVEIMDLVERKYGSLELSVVTKKTPMEELIDSYYEGVCSNVYGSREQIRTIVESIIMNRVVNESRLDDTSKINSRDSILLYGPAGNGKNTILDSIKKTFQVPIADFDLTPDFKNNLETIAKQLLASPYKNYEEGIVIVRDTYDRLATSGEDPFEHFKELLNKIRYYDKDNRELVIDFSKLTFITVKSVKEELDSEIVAPMMSAVSDCEVALYIPSLSKVEIRAILKNDKYSRISIYNEMLAKFHKKVVFTDPAIDFLIDRIYPLGEGLKIINLIIDRIVKDLWMINDKNIVVSKNLIYIYTEAFLRANKEHEKIKGKLDSIIDEPKLLPGNASNRSTSKKKTKRIEDMDADELTKIIKKAICAQDEHVRRIIFTILRNRKIAYKDGLNNPKRYIKNILLRGESGSGKTAIINEVSKLLNIPIFVADATQYTENGFKGADVTDMLANLYLAADGNLEEAERGILVIDEIDKKAATGGDIDVSRGAVLNSLLKIVEGCVMPIEIGSGLSKQTIQFDTSRLTVICSGAFENIEKVRDARLSKGVTKSMGFGSYEKQEEQKKNLDPNIIDEDYVAFGMSRQFVARLGVIVNLNKLEPKDLVDIMKNSNLSELTIQKELYKLDGIELEYTPEFYEELAKMAYNKKIGGRGIEKALQEVFGNLNIENINGNKYSKVIFNGECINDPSKLELVERPKRKVKSK